VDECHRGSAGSGSSWRAVLEHFGSATQLGMTATPKRDDTVDTYDYFGSPLYEYSLAQGIDDGFLAPYRVLRVVLSPDAHGWAPDQGQLDLFGQSIPPDLYTIVSEPSAEVAYYYPAPYWTADEGNWVKTLLVFFDRVAILLPGYMYGRHLTADPTLAGPLEDRGLLEVLEPNTWVDQKVTEDLATVLVDLLIAGAFDDLPSPPGDRFQELSYSRMGYGADVGLSEMLVDELMTRGLARPTEDGVSVPLHPIVRTTILVVLGQLARVAGTRRGMAVHPATNDFTAARDLIRVLDREPMPSAGHVISLDLEAVTLNLDSVPLDDVLDFRAEHGDAHKSYMRSLRGFLAELAAIDAQDRERMLLERRQELADAAHELRTTARRGFAKDLSSWSLGLAGATWAIAAADPLGLALTAAGLLAGAVPERASPPSAYSYVFSAERHL